MTLETPGPEFSGIIRDIKGANNGLEIEFFRIRYEEDNPAVFNGVAIVRNFEVNANQVQIKRFLPNAEGDWGRAILQAKGASVSTRIFPETRRMLERLSSAAAAAVSAVTSIFTSDTGEEEKTRPSVAPVVGNILTNAAVLVNSENLDQSQIGVANIALPAREDDEKGTKEKYINFIKKWTPTLDQVVDEILNPRTGVTHTAAELLDLADEVIRNSDRMTTDELSEFIDKLIGFTKYETTIGASRIDTAIDYIAASDAAFATAHTFVPRETDYPSLRLLNAGRPKRELQTLVSITNTPSNYDLVLFDMYPSVRFPGGILMSAHCFFTVSDPASKLFLRDVVYQYPTSVNQVVRGRKIDIWYELEDLDLLVWDMMADVGMYGGDAETFSVIPTSTHLSRLVKDQRILEKLYDLEVGVSNDAVNDASYITQMDVIVRKLTTSPDIDSKRRIKDMMSAIRIVGNRREQLSVDFIAAELLCFIVMLELFSDDDNWRTEIEKIHPSVVKLIANDFE